MRVLGYFIAVGAVSAVAGCTGMEQETEPVKVNTDQGVVTCQLYLPDVVMLDEAIDWPEVMTKQVGDAVCRAEGTRRLREMSQSS